MKPKFEMAVPGWSILILGFGMEGRSTARFLKSYFPDRKITVADRNENLLSEVDLFEFENFKFKLGADYLNDLDQFDLIIKAPGIPNSLIEGKVSSDRLTSQTEIFLKLFRDRTIGITGTKGKSTTSSLISHILQRSGTDVFLLGNIGNPPLDFTGNILDGTQVVFEMSSHQLDGLQISPHISVFLNLFEEHLDHYKDLEFYRQAKYNVFKHQEENDSLVYNLDDERLSSDLKLLQRTNNMEAFSGVKHNLPGAFLTSGSKVEYRGNGGFANFDFSERIGIPGTHNLMNIMAAVCVCKLLSIDNRVIEQSVNEFKGLEHRLEYVGKFKDVIFYNDSIATIPEATIEAIKTLGPVDILILGGKDRGIDYSALVRQLKHGDIRNIILMGEVGTKLFPILKSELPPGCRLFPIDKFEELRSVIQHNATKNGICLLSPAASSYDMFKNFEERGHAFKRIARNL